MKYNIQELKEGIKLHQINTDIFKTNLYAIFIAIPLTRKNVTLNALLTAVLRRGSASMPSQEIISKKLEEMYGASFDCGIEKLGDNHILKFYLEAISEDFLPEKEELEQKCLDILLDIVFNPLTHEYKEDDMTANNSFKEEYVQTEKQNLKQIIEGKIDNKAKFALDRCIEEMFKNEPYGLYKYGYVQDLNNITAQSLYEYYKELIYTCKIDIFCSGAINEEKTKRIIEENECFKSLVSRKPEYVINNIKAKEENKEKEIKDSMEVTQGKLVIGLNIKLRNEEEKFTASVYNAILGGGANSKLFQNVREKERLAYTANSNYVRQKNCIFIRCGIEIENYQKALDTIKQQLQDIKEGNFSQKDIESAKTLIIETIKSIPAEQDTQITYYYSQELSEAHVTLEKYTENIEKQTKEQIVKLAQNINIDTIYFLKD